MMPQRIFLPNPFIFAREHMVENEKVRKKAQVILEKIKFLMDSKRLKKSAEYFEKAGNFYAELEEWKVFTEFFPRSLRRHYPD